MRILNRMALSLLFMSLSFRSWGAAEENVPAICVPNGDFEQEYTRDRRLGGSPFERIQEAPFQGKSCCRVTPDQKQTWLPDNWRRGVFPIVIGDIDKLNGKSLQLRFAARFNKINGKATLQPLLTFMDSEGKSLDRSCTIDTCFGITENVKWRQYDMDFVVPAKAAKMAIYIYARTPEGASYDLDDIHLDMVKPQAMRLSYSHPAVLPIPKSAQWKQEMFDLAKAKTIVYYPDVEGFEKETAQKIKRYLGNLGVDMAEPQSGEGANPEDGGIVLGSLKNEKFIAFLAQRNADLLGDLRNLKSKGEGFVLSLGPNATAILAGQDGAGVYYAFRTLLQMARFDPERVPQCRIADWPDHPHRSFLALGMPRPLIGAPWEVTERYIFDLLAGSRYNELTIKCNRWELLFEDGDNVKLNRPDQQLSLTRAEMKKLIIYANENFIKVYPGLNNHCNCEWILTVYPELAEYPNTKEPKCRWTACTKNPEYYKVLFPVMKEVYEVFGQQPVFLIGHDEIRFSKDAPSSCPFCKDTPKWQIVADDIIKQKEYLNSLGVKEVRIFDDMLLEDWNGGPPFNVAKARALLPKDMVILHWLGENGSLNSDEPFFKEGFTNVIWSPTEEVTEDILPDDVRKYSSIGMNRCGGESPWTSWERSNTGGLIDASYRNFQIIYRVGDLLWNAKDNKHPISWKQFPYEMGTAIMRNTSARHIKSSTQFSPIELNGAINLKESWKLPGGGYNFQAHKQLISDSVFHDLANDGKAIVLAKGEDRRVEINKKAQKIAILHAAHIDESQYDAFRRTMQQRYRKQLPGGIPVGTYTLTYEDGTSKSISIELGYNVFFNQHRSYQRSLLLWDASEVWCLPQETGLPQLCSIYVFENPYPEKTLKYMDAQIAVPSLQLAIFSVGPEK